MKTSAVCPTSTATMLVCQKIAQSFRENIYELSRVRKDWNLEYANSLNATIDDIIENYYTDSLESIHEKKYMKWHEVMVAGLQSLKVLRAALKVDFKNEKSFLKELFKKLGYSDYFSDAKNGDHLSLYNFLTAFTQNLDEETKQKIIQKGIPSSLFDKIYETAKQIEDYKCCFETLGTENLFPESVQKNVTDIYEDIKDICRIAIAYFQFEPLKRDEFDFYKVMVYL